METGTMFGAGRDLTFTMEPNAEFGIKIKIQREGRKIFRLETRH
jgi:hypothetical protein